MTSQASWILGLIAALIIAIFAVINVDAVTVNYLFGTAEWPLILVILGSVVMGAVIVGSFGMVRTYRLKREVRQWKKQAEAVQSADSEKERTVGNPQSQQERSTDTHDNHSPS
ncbi:LapA family protein [Bacillus piscicola]|uniref:LapA family protein n=1 Tax=Bacillus piscicola TaxID=1632684 RepID=UPI001F09C718|nr:lipopolysaccharide assembly protein LapA domain-containing protein [Bacillus piscicola]